MLPMNRIRLVSLALLFSVSFAVPRTTFAQAVGDGVVADDDSFVSDEPDVFAVKHMNVRSNGRQIGEASLRNVVKGALSGAVESPSISRGDAGSGDVSANVLVNDPALDNIQTFTGTRPFEESTQSETSVAVFGQHVLVGYNSSANQAVVLICNSLFFTRRLLSAFS